MNKSSKQTTLFQSWGGKKKGADQKKEHVSCATKSASNPDSRGDAAALSNQTDGVVWLDDEDDGIDELLMTIPLDDESINYGLNHRKSTSSPQTRFSNCTTFSDGRGAPHSAAVSLSNDVGCNSHQPMPDCSDLPGFDPHAGRLWIYPTNYPVRDYQFNILQTALFKNTLVALPTGLGKTFIAAVLMYNLYRWYPQGKVVFMAPTKPLVSQQIEACYNIMGIPQDDTAELTGAMHRGKRTSAWKLKRVFYLTPQVLMNDISSGTCPARLVRCLVVDEAHKATGNYAYCQVVKELAKYKGLMRILALSATPGADIKAVQEVISNLMISHIELRTEQSPDIQPYTHERKVEKVVVPLGEELGAVKEKYLQIVEVVVNRLKHNGVLYQRNVTQISKFLLLKAREAFRQNPPENMQRFTHGTVEADFALGLSLYHGLELLQQHGLRSLYNYLHGIMVGEKGYGRTRSELQRDSRFCELMDQLRAKFQPIRAAVPHTQQTPGERDTATSLAAGHPKMSRLEELVLEHFHRSKEDGGDLPTSTRIMIFSQYRDSVSEITEMLSQHRPLVKVISFIGQSCVNKGSKGFTQKEQIRVMRQFREGGYNTLVSTCVGEEGLDIGDVDLIVCFDAHKSPIRLVQRMGRTGRKRKGRIIMLLTEGREEQIYNQSQYNKKSIDRAIANSTKSLRLYPHSARMVPEGFTPSCHKLHMTVAEKTDRQGKERPKKTKVATEKPHRVTSVDKRNLASGFLTKEEETYWAENLQVDAREVPQMPESSMLTMKSTTPRASSSEKQHTLSLSAYTPWQNTLQKTHLVGHSQHSRNLVELMQFIEIMGIAGESGADMYDTEMRSYLHNEDVIPSKRKKGLAAYLQPIDTAQAGAACTKRKRDNGDDAVGPSRKTHRSDALPGFSSSEDDRATDDEADLPEFRTMMSSVSGNKQCKKTKASRKPVSSPVDTIKRPSLSDKHGKAMKTKNLSQGVSAMGERASNLTLMDTTTSCANHSSSDVQHVDVDDSESRPDKTESTEVGITCGDIDDVFEPSMVEKEEDNNGDQGSPGLENPQQDSQSLHDANFASEVDAANDFFPGYASGKTSPGISATGVQGLSCFNIGPVPEPPSEEELIAAMEELDSKRCISPVDILTLIDSWEKERCRAEVSLSTGSKNGKYSHNIGSKNKEGHGSKTNKESQNICSKNQGIGAKNKCRPCSPPNGLSGSSMTWSWKKQRKMSVSANNVKIAAPFALDSTVNVGTMDRGENAPERSDSIHEHSMNDSDHGPCHKTNGKLECHNTVNDGVCAKRNQSCESMTVIENKGKDVSYLFNQIRTPDSNFKHGQPTKKQTLTKGKPSPIYGAEKGAMSGKNTNVRTSPGSPVVPSQCRVTPWSGDNGDIDTNVEHFLDTSHFSFTQALASVDDSFVSPSPITKTKHSAITLKAHGRQLFTSQRGKTVEVDKSPDGLIFKYPSTECTRDTGNMGTGGISKAGCIRSESTNVGEFTASDRTFKTPRRNTSCTVVRPESVSPTLFDSADEDDDKVASKYNQAQGKIIVETTADDIDLPNFSLLDEEEEVESCIETASEDDIETAAPENALDLPGFNLLDDDSFDELDFDLGFDMSESDEDARGSDDAPNAEGGVTHGMSPHSLTTEASSKRCSVTPSERVHSVSNLCASSPAKFNVETHCSDAPKPIVHPTFVSGSLCSPLNSRNQTDHSVSTHNRTSISPVMDESVQSCRNTRSGGSKLRLNTRHNHSVQFTENSERPSDNGMSMQHPAFRGRKTEQPCDSGRQLRNATVTGRTMEKPGHLQKDTEHGFSLSESSLSASKENEHRKQVKVSKSSTCCAYVNPMNKLGASRPSSSDFVEPLHGRRISHRNKKTCSNDARAKPPPRINDNARRKWFLDEEAVLSGSDDASDDEEDANFDLMEASFIDDATQLSQSQAHSVDSRAMYLQSVRSPGFGGARGAKFKLSYQSDPDNDVFSQERSDESRYLSDSFCIGSDELEEPDPEGAKIESAEDDLFTPPKRTHPSEATTTDGSTIKHKRKRVVRLASSSDEDCQNDVTSQSRPPVKKFITCSSSKGRSHSTMTSSRHSHIGQNFNDTRRADTRLPLMSHGNMTTSDRGMTSPAARGQSDVGNEGSSHPTTSHMTTSTSAAQQSVSRDSRLSAASNHSSVTMDAPERTGKLVVFVDSREVNCAQDLMSSLRLKHDLHPIVRQLESCDYVVSARMAVERKLLSDFTNGSNKQKLVDRLQLMCQTYERPCLIVETDRQGRHGDQTVHKPLLKSKEVERTLARLAQSHVKVLFSDSQDETADLLAELCRSEDKKHVALRLDRTPLDAGHEQVLDFYLSLPKMTNPMAVSALTSYNTLSRFLHSSPASISRNSLVSQPKAEEIHKFVRHEFDLQMTPCRKLARTGSNLNKSR